MDCNTLFIIALECVVEKLIYVNTHDLAANHLKDETISLERQRANIEKMISYAHELNGVSKTVQDFLEPLFSESVVNETTLNFSINLDGIPGREVILDI